MEPPSVTILDVSPYNIFTLTCTASLSTDVNANTTFEWRKGAIPVNHNGITVVISDTDVGESVSTSTLVTREHTTGTFTYACISSILDEEAAVTSTVLVKGMFHGK